MPEFARKAAVLITEGSRAAGFEVPGVLKKNDMLNNCEPLGEAKE